MGGDWITGTLCSSLRVVRAVKSRPSRVAGWEGLELTSGEEKHLQGTVCGGSGAGTVTNSRG